MKITTTDVISNEVESQVIKDKLRKYNKKCPMCKKRNWQVQLDYQIIKKDTR